MTGILFKLGSACVRRRWVVLALWLVAAVVALGAAKATGSRTVDNIRLPGSEAQEASDLLAQRFPSQANGSSPIVFHANRGSVNDPANRAAIEASFKRIGAIPWVYAAVDPFSEAGKVLGEVSPDGTTAYISVSTRLKPGNITVPLAQEVLDAASQAREAGMQVAAGGIIGSRLDDSINDQADRVGLLFAVVILALVFGSLVAMGMPILTALLGLSIGLSLITLFTHMTQIPTQAPILATMIGLGVGIDYALFMVMRHREGLRRGLSVRDSISRATATSGGAIVFAGGTVVIAIASLGFAGIPIVTMLGLTTSVVVLIAVLAAITLMPAALAIVGTGISRLSIPRFLRPREKDPMTGAWARWADQVGRHPWLAVGTALALLFPLMSPALSLTLGQPDQALTPKEQTLRQAYDLIAREYGPGYNGPLLLAVTFPSPLSASASFLADKASLHTIGDRLLASKAHAKNRRVALSARGRELKRRGAELAAIGAPLLSAEARLEVAGARLLARKQELIDEGTGLAAAKSRLQRRAALLQARGGALGGLLQEIVVDEQVVAQELENATDPATIAALQARLASLQARQARVQGKLAAIQVKGAKLSAQGRALAAAAQRLRRRGASLARRALQLKRSRAFLAEEATALLARRVALTARGRVFRERVAVARRNGLHLRNRARVELTELHRVKASLAQQLIDAGGVQRATDLRLAGLMGAIRSTEGVAKVGPPQLNEDGTVAVFSAIPRWGPSDPRTAALVKELRATVVPKSVGSSGVEAYVGGMTAGFADLASSIARKLPGIIAIVVALSFFLLMLAFRSIAIPVKAAIMNILSVTAAYGVLVAVFQWGWGTSVVGLSGVRSVPIVSYVPLIMFAVLFGLSMDYEVFLLSQVVENHNLGMSDHDSVVAGLARSARVITAAALIMVAVFASFILNPDPTIKQFGVGLSVAVALDATIVRILLVPATMTLLGRANWWLPRWLSTILPRVDLEGERYFRATATTGKSTATYTSRERGVQ